MSDWGGAVSWLVSPDSRDAESLGVSWDGVFELVDRVDVS